MANSKTALLTLSLVAVASLGACSTYGPGGQMLQPTDRFVDPQATASWCPGVGVGVSNAACASGKYQMMDQMASTGAYPVPAGIVSSQPRVQYVQRVPAPAQAGQVIMVPMQQQVQPPQNDVWSLIGKVVVGGLAVYGTVCAAQDGNC